MPSSTSTTAGTFVATSTTATSTFAGSVQIAGTASSTSLFSTVANIATAIINSLTVATANITTLVASTITGTNAAITNLSAQSASVGSLNLATALGIASGGTGIATAPTPGQILVGNGSGGYTLTSTSSLGIQPTWGTITGSILSQTDLQSALNAKLSSSSLPSITTLASLSLPYSQVTGAPTSLASSTLLSDSDTWSGTQTFANLNATIASSTNLFAQSASLGSLSGAAFSSLTSNSVPKWNNGTWSNSLLFDNGTGVGIGTTSPGATFAVNGSGYLSGNLAVLGTINLSKNLLSTMIANTTPSRLGNWGSILTAFNGDDSHMGIGLLHETTGTSLGTPSTGYLEIPELAAVASYDFNSSGYNASLSGNDGRTGAFNFLAKNDNYGQGDSTSYFCEGFVDSSLAGATSFLAEPEVGCLGGGLSAYANGDFMEGVGDIDFTDNGFDTAVAGLVFNFARTNATGNLNTNWMGIDLQSGSGSSQPVDSEVRIAGRAKIGFDFTKATFPDRTVATITLLNGGAGYAVGDLLTPPDGTYSQQTVLRVLSVDTNGTILTFGLDRGGLYTAVPANPSSVVGGNGSGASFNIAYNLNGNAMLATPADDCWYGNATNDTSVYGTGFSSTVKLGTSLVCFSSALSAWNFITSSSSILQLYQNKAVVNGNLGVGTTSPMYPLDVVGFVNTSISGGYMQGGNLVLYASSTIGSTFAGIGAGATVIANATSSAPTSGPYSTAFGYQALAYASSSADGSTAIGYQALRSTTAATGSGGNTAVGYQALLQNTSGFQNDAIGYGALLFNTQGYENDALGTAALYNNTSGDYNIGIGWYAGTSNQTGSRNISIGKQSGGGGAGSVASNSNNVSVGFNSGYGLTTGSQNVFMGNYSASTTQTGSNNIAIGFNIALPSINGSNQLDIGNLIYGTGINGQYGNLSTGNIGIGTTTPGSIFSIGSTNGINFSTATSTFSSTGGINLISGCFAVSGVCIGANYFSNSGNNTWLSTGTQLGINTVSPGYALDVAGFINTDQYSGFKQAGNTVLYASTTNNSLAIGASSAAGWMSASSSAWKSVAIGQGALATTPTSGAAVANIAVGLNALYSNTTGTQNTANGVYALQNNTTGSNNTANGVNALYLNTTGNYNTANGVNALYNNTTGYANIAIGMNSLIGNTTGYFNTANGFQALIYNTTGSNNTANGMNALYYNQSATNTVAVGYQAAKGTSLYSNQGGVAIGYNAGLNFATSSDYNTLLGYQSGYDITTGNNNLILGTEQTTGGGITTGSNNILIGKGVRVGLNQAGSNQLNIGNLVFATGIGTENMLSSGYLGIGTSSPYSKLEVWGPDSASTTAFSVVNNASTTVFASYDNGNATYSGSLFQSSDQRLKSNISSLNASSSLSLVDQLNPVSYTRIDQPDQGSTLGFIAQEVQKLFPNLVTTTAATALTPGGTLTLNYTGLIAPLVAAVQALQNEIASIQGAITGFAQSFTTALLHANEADVQKLCLTDSSGSTCYTRSQLNAALAAAVQSTASVVSVTVDSTSSSQAPIISINGDNPAIIQIGSAYSDLGATIPGPAGDINLGIHTFVNGIAMSPVQIDTSAAATDTIDYVVTDQNGLTSTSTRTVIVQAYAPLKLPGTTSAASSSVATSTEE